MNYAMPEGDVLEDNNERLVRVEKEILNLARQIKNHLKAYGDYIDENKEKFMISDNNYEYLRNSQDRTNKLLVELTKNTKDMIELQSDFRAVLRVADKAQKFATWWLKWPLIATAVGVVTNFFINLYQGIQ